MVSGRPLADYEGGEETILYLYIFWEVSPIESSVQMNVSSLAFLKRKSRERA